PRPPLRGRPPLHRVPEAYSRLPSPHEARLLSTRARSTRGVEGGGLELGKFASASEVTPPSHCARRFPVPQSGDAVTTTQVRAQRGMGRASLRGFARASTDVRPAATYVIPSLPP